MRFAAMLISAVLLFIPQVVIAAVHTAHRPCTLHSPTTGSFFDLASLAIAAGGSPNGNNNGHGNGANGPSNPVHKPATAESWRALGHDYPANFTLNVCAPVVEPLKDVVGVEEARWRNVSAFYRLDGKTYSIGQQSAAPIFRGRKLVLNYTDGSPCATGGRKSTIMSFHCDPNPASVGALVSFVGTVDSCSYFFEVRSSAACGGVAANTEGGLSPAGVFGLIAAIAVAVYLVGGCVYQRVVMHQRGWRQCPNAGLWAGIVSFFKDMLIIGLSALGRTLRLRRSGSGSDSAASGADRGIVGAFGGRRRGRGARDVDEENRLIDQLDEEWED